jgi:uncharacterized LabA/DUF88 family protein
MSKLPGQRVAILVDGQNIFLTAKGKGAKPNYRSMLDRLNGRNIVRAILYNIEPDGVDQSKFKYSVENMGYEVKSKRPRPLPDGSHKADWDMQIAIDALALADKVDVMVILTGDTDFVPLVYALKTRGVKVEILSFRENTGHELIESADVYIPINAEMLIKESRDYSHR